LINIFFELDRNFRPKHINLSIIDPDRSLRRRPWVAFLGRFRERLVSDRPAIELILSKIIQIDHIDLFFRFLEAIMQNTTLEEFNHSGYMSIFVRGSQKGPDFPMYHLQLKAGVHAANRKGAFP
jgi:hypothetical protein